MRWSRWPLRRRVRQGTAAARRPWLAFLGAFWPFLLGSVLVAGGLAAIVLGYLGVAGTVHVGLQLPYLVSGGLLGVALVTLGGALLVTQALGRQARLLRRLLEETRAKGPAREGGGEPTPDGMVVVPKGATRFHRPACLLAEGKEVRRMKPATAASRGLSPCPVCDPWGPERAGAAAP
ncbi:MAG: hypothetical protein ACRDI0_08075 [Actinomycetota bacterium]